MGKLLGDLGRVDEKRTVDLDWYILWSPFCVKSRNDDVLGLCSDEVTKIMFLADILMYSW